MLNLSPKCLICTNCTLQSQACEINELATASTSSNTVAGQNLSSNVNRIFVECIQMLDNRMRRHIAELNLYRAPHRIAALKISYADVGEKLTKLLDRNDDMAIKFNCVPIQREISKPHYIFLIEHLRRMSEQDVAKHFNHKLHYDAEYTNCVSNFQLIQAKGIARIDYSADEGYVWGSDANDDEMTRRFNRVKGKFALKRYNVCVQFINVLNTFFGALLDWKTISN